MNKFFYHYIIKNNFEKFEKYLTKKDGKNLITCKASLFLEKIIAKLKNDTTNKLVVDLSEIGTGDINFTVNPEITYFTPTFKRYNFFSNDDDDFIKANFTPRLKISYHGRDANFIDYPKISYRRGQDKPPPNMTSKPKHKKTKSRKNRGFMKNNRSSKNRNRKNGNRKNRKNR